MIDEAPRLPALIPLLRHVIDRGRGSGRFVLMGSASPSLPHTVSETLAGRLGLLEVTPFSARELAVTRTWRWRWKWRRSPKVWMDATTPERAPFSSSAARKERRIVS